MSAPHVDPGAGSSVAALLTMLHVDGDAAVASTLHALDAGGIDWTALVAAALEHHVAPALMPVLTDPRLRDAVPGELVDALALYCGQMRTLNVRQAAELCRIASTFEDEGIPVIPFKGVVLAELLYSDLGLRPAGDVDLLVRATDLARVRARLESCGYRDVFDRRAAMTPVQRRLYERQECEYEFFASEAAQIVEPHWAYAPRWLAVDVDYDGLFERSRLEPLWDCRVRVHPAEDLLLALCIHGGKHEWERIAWIRDVAVMVARFPRLDMDVALSRALAYGCRRMLLLGLELARTLVGAPVPDAAVRAIEREPAVAQLAAHVRRVHVRGRPIVQNVWPNAFCWNLHDRADQRLRYLARIALPPRRTHLELVALPQPLSWMYYPVRWVSDYVMRPAWLLTRRVLPRRSSRTFFDVTFS